jgi:hypothetical protein
MKGNYQPDAPAVYSYTTEYLAGWIPEPVRTGHSLALGRIEM